MKQTSHNDKVCPVNLFEQEPEHMADDDKVCTANLFEISYTQTNTAFMYMYFSSHCCNTHRIVLMFTELVLFITTTSGFQKTVSCFVSGLNANMLKFLEH